MLDVTLPVRTVSEANTRGHWATRSRRVKAHRTAAHLALRSRVRDLTLPAVVVLTRCAPSAGLDDDNLRSALKAVRDGVADALGVDDRDPRVRWEYRQERAPRGRWSVAVRVMAAAAGDDGELMVAGEW